MNLPKNAKINKKEGHEIEVFSEGSDLLSSISKDCPGQIDSKKVVR